MVDTKNSLNHLNQIHRITSFLVFQTLLNLELFLLKEEHFFNFSSIILF